MVFFSRTQQGQSSLDACRPESYQRSWPPSSRRSSSDTTISWKIEAVRFLSLIDLFLSILNRFVLDVHYIFGWPNYLRQRNRVCIRSNPNRVLCVCKLPSYRTNNCSLTFLCRGIVNNVLNCLVLC